MYSLIGLTFFLPSKTEGWSDTNFFRFYAFEQCQPQGAKMTTGKEKEKKQC